MTKSGAAKGVRGGKVVIAGGSGYLGRRLATRLSKQGYDVVILSREQAEGGKAWTWVHWDGRTLGPWAEQLDGAVALVNLAGRSVDCVKTPDHCDEILRSRVESTRVLGAALRRVAQVPPVWVQMSTAHIYGDPPAALCDEDSAPGFGLAPTVGMAWEAAHAEALVPGMRSVVLRTSFVLGRSEGALRKLGRVAKWGLGGTVGHGRQGISWIHEEDMDRLFERAITDASMQGVYVATAPNPVSNREFMRALRRAVGQPVGLPAAAWMVRLGAPRLLKTDPELAIYGRYCVSKRLADEGFEFVFPDVGPALRDLYA